MGKFWRILYPHGQTTCTVANALNVTFFGNSPPLPVLLEDPPPAPRGELDLMTGLSGGRGFAVSRPAEVARSRSFWEMPLPVPPPVKDDDDLFDGAINWGKAVGVMYL
ncbi:hypothetical protein quinque_001200 [Culex quinquefasciatus]